MLGETGSGFGILKGARGNLANVQPARSIDRGRLAYFIGSLVVLSSAVAAIGMVTDLEIVQLGSIYMFTPAIAALLVFARRDVGRSELGIRIGRIRWLAIAALLVFPLVVAMILLSVAWPDIGFVPAADPIPWLPRFGPVSSLLAYVTVIIGVGITVNAVFAFGEELGWRGYLLWELAPLGFWPASAVVGIAWGIWHAPLILGGYNYPGFPIVGVLLMTMACITLSPIYTYLVLRARSVFAAVFFHGVFNAGAGAVIVYTRPGGIVMDQLVASPVGVAGIIVFALASIAIAVSGPPELTRMRLEDPT